jgi:hypothetical protein
MADLNKQIRNNPFAPPTMQPNPLMPPPMPAPPADPNQGFQSWASDQRNALKVQPAMTSPSSPLQPNAPSAMSAIYNPPGAPKPLPTQQQDQAANPGAYAKPVMGTKVGAGLTIAASALAGAAGGMKGNPGAGLEYALKVKAADDQIGQDNTDTYNKRIVQPSKDALDTQYKQAQISHLGAETTELQNRPDKAAPTDKQIHAYVGTDGKQHVIMLRPNNTTYDTAFGDVSQKDGKPDTPEQQFIDEFQRKNPGKGVADAVRAYSDATQKPEREPKQLAVAPDGSVIELRPGVKVPQGTKSVAGELKGQEPTADEKRRGDLANNLNENFDKLEDILKRRPELFGPMAGRMTSVRSAFGTSDPDIAALETIKHQVGMAQISAHGMRSAQGIDEAAKSLLNNFNNTPAAMMGGIGAARDSVKTFLNDAGKGTPQPHPFTPPTMRNPAPATSLGPKVGTVEGGFRFKGGDASNPNNWEKVR